MAVKAWSYWAAAGVVVWHAGAWLVAEQRQVARQVEDADTIDCLMQRLSPEEKYRLARLGNAEDYRPLWLAYSEVFPRCVLHASQWERKDRLMFAAWSLLRGEDLEFSRAMLRASRE